MIRGLFLLIVLLGSLNPLVASSKPFVELDILIVLASKNMTDEEYNYAIDAVRSLENNVFLYSEGMATTNVDLVFHDGDIPYGLSDKGNLFPDDIRIAVDFGGADYDYAGVIVSPSMAPIYQSEGIRGMANVAGTDTFWVASMRRVEYVILHELAHVIEADKVEAGYTNFPECGENTQAGGGVHCAIAYGYPGASSEAWLDDYYSGDLHDGTGLTEEGWKT